MNMRIKVQYERSETVSDVSLPPLSAYHRTSHSWYKRGLRLGYSITRYPLHSFLKNNLFIFPVSFFIIPTWSLLHFYASWPL